MEIRHPQQAIYAKCFYPSGSFTEFSKEDVERSIPDRFKQIVAKYPDRIAVKTKHHELTYDALNKAANRVAHAILAQRGDGAEPVALLAEHDVHTFAAMLGILKAGKICVPLDPSHPEARAAYLLEHSEANALITSNENLSLATTISKDAERLINLDEIGAHTPTGNVGLHISPDALAFIVHTSGSTGTPKGVMQSHRNVLHWTLKTTNYFHICADDRIGLLASLGASQAKANIFNALLNGATLCAFNIKEEGVTHLADWLISEGITVYASAATIFRDFAGPLTGKEKFPKLRLVKLGAEQIRNSDVQLYKNHFPEECLFGAVLSSSETGALCQYFLNKQTEIVGDTVPVGYPAEDMEIVLINNAGEKVSFNEIGEITVRSRYLSPGYWGRPDLTAAKFSPDPDGGDKRIYRSGDLGRIRPDGCIEHLGRKDLRVKIRGFGVELAEVEATLRRHPAVREAVVEARTDESEDNRLLAYIVPERDQAPTISEIRRFLQAKLPEHMIPSTIMILEAMPLTPNGKVDRRALPRPGKSRPHLDTPLVAPRTLVEKQLTQIWADVLGLDQIGIHDNFFDLGGHSLSAARIISRIHDDLQVELSLSHFFETRTVATLAGYIERARSPQDGAKTLSIQPTLRDGQLLLSFAQQRLWFLNQLEPDSPAYNQPKAMRLDGTLNVEALRKTLNTIVARHEVLRTSFVSIDGQPVQVVGENLSVELPVIDLTQWPDDKQEAELQRLMVEITERPFDLSQDLMLRATLLRLAPAEHVLLLVTHHIASDGWSTGLLFQEITALYEAFSKNRPSPLPDLPIQYADFAVWQLQWLQGKVLEAHLSYWKNQLSGVPVLELPTDRPRSAVQTFRAARKSLVLPKGISAGLKALSRKEGITLFMTLLAAFQTLLHRYTGQEDIAVGSPIANRTRDEIEGLIGFFVNTLVLRSDLSGNPSFRELLARVRNIALDAYEHQDLPFEKLVEELNPDRSLNRAPLFQVMFVFQNAPRSALELPGLTVSSVEVSSGTAKFDLMLSMVEEANSLKASLEYNTDLFDAATISRMLGHFQTLLEGIAANPKERLSDLPILSEAQRQQLLVEWNDTEKRYLNEKCIHELFEAQVERSPNAVAVVVEDKQLTYQELNQRANQLAHHLRSLDVGRDVAVGICLERSLEMVVGVLAILKAGGAYVPLDPAYPKERLALMLENAQAQMLLTQKSLVDTLPAHNRQVICLDTDWEIIARKSGDNPVSAASAESLVYVIYTSGSTGRPKAVALPHRALSNLIAWQLRDFRQHETSRTLQFTSLSFDVSFQEIFTTWCSGGTLVIVAESVRQDVNRLACFIAERNIDRMFLPFVALQQLAETVSSQKQPSMGLREIITAGEQLHVTQPIIRLFSQLGHCSLHNQYGPSESHVVTSFALTDPPECWPALPPIGRPIANTQIYILDSQLRPVPVGVTGELYIGGVSLARGYLDSPDLTAEKFIPNPFSNESGKRLYKTGDLARYLPDGNIEFLGRIDHQIKIRGFRIELGEIEAVLGQHPAVRETVVLAREDIPSDKRLVAYVAANQAPTLTAGELRNFLKAKLPDYMIPSTFMFLDALPLTPNGKVNRRALPPPDQTRPELEEAFVAPRTPLESEIAGIWAEILKLERVGIHDNFFDLGGHSLLATRLVSRLREALHIDIPLRSLFENPTVAAFAAEVAQIQAKDSAPKIAELLADLESLSDEEAQRLVAQQDSKNI